MNKYIALSFVFMGWAFYEMSGGADFTPAGQSAGAAVAETKGDVAKPRVASIGENPSQSMIVKAVAKPEPKAAVTRASFSQPSFDLRAPNTEELAAIDPAVLNSFEYVLREGGDTADNALVVPAAATKDIRTVSGNRVNMRNGPGTDYSIVDRLSRGNEVEVIAAPGNGWLKLRVSESGRIGWMADFLVSDPR